jgi:steroid 5-alpha reductase family enzyme
VTQVLAIAGAFAATCWLASLLTREHSWTDRLWSIVPVVYVAVFALLTPSPRLWLMLALVALWGVRLTFNFARKGGYRRGGEDYRWAELRRRMSPATFQLFNFFFVTIAQHALLVALVLPAHVAAAHASPLGPLDAVATALFVLFLVLETVADEQQWRFQREKHERLARGGPAAPAFVATGLFRYSRHPAFFCEQAIWWTFYLFAVAASGRWLHVALVGPVGLTLLFHGSTSFTESISRSRYPEYADYQRTTSRLIPWPPTR